MKRRASAVVFACALGALWPCLARAEPACSEKELVALDRVIERDAAANRRWYYGWSSAFLAVGVGQIFFGEYVLSQDQRPDMRVGAFMSGLGWAATIALPPPLLFAEGSDPSRHADPAYRARACERERAMIKSAAEDEQFGKGWLSHTAGIAANLASGLYLWRKHDRLGSAILQTVGGIAVAEFQIWTRPSAARDFQMSMTATPLAGGASLGVSVTF